MTSSLRVRFRLRRAADSLGPKQMVVVDLGTVTTKVLLLNRSGRTVTCTAARVLPAASEDFRVEGESLDRVLEREGLLAQYGSLLLSGRGGAVRLLNFPGRPPSGEGLRTQLAQTLGLDEDTTEMRYTVIRQSEGSEGKAEYSVLVATLPGDLVADVRKMYENAGIMPVSLVPAGVAALNVASRFPGLGASESDVVFMEIGGRNSRLMAFVNGGAALIREFPTGAAHVIEALMASTQLDFDTALKLYESGSFDFSNNVSRVVEPWLHQVGISLDFVERRFGARMETLYLFGGGARSRVLERILDGGVRCAVRHWDPVGEKDGFFRLDAADADLFVPALAEGLRFVLPPQVASGE